MLDIPHWNIYNAYDTEDPCCLRFGQSGHFSVLWYIYIWNEQCIEAKEIAHDNKEEFQILK